MEIADSLKISLNLFPKKAINGLWDVKVTAVRIESAAACSLISTALRIGKLGLFFLYENAVQHLCSASNSESSRKNMLILQIFDSLAFSHDTLIIL